MKKLISFFAFAVLVAATCVTATSCSDDDDEKAGGKIDAKAIVGRWQITHTRNNAAEDWKEWSSLTDTYLQFFESGFYTNVLGGKTMLEGYYEVVDGKKIIIKLTNGNTQIYEILSKSKKSMELALLSSDGETPTAYYRVALIKQEDDSGKVDGHEAVDLGLPDGVYWASCNVGASKPEEFGDFFAWGETATKDDYSWNTYKYGDYADTFVKFVLNKYCWSKEFGQGYVDTLTILQPSDDAVVANWGGGWRTPTKEQYQTLIDNCEVKVDSENGVTGIRFTSKKNGNSIFLPAVGLMSGTNYLNSGNKAYRYWTSSLDTKSTPANANVLYFTLTPFKCVVGSAPRDTGYNIRAVIKKK